MMSIDISSDELIPRYAESRPRSSRPYSDRRGSASERGSGGDDGRSAGPPATQPSSRADRRRLPPCRHTGAQDAARAPAAPDGSLALAAIASGAFSTFLLRRVTLDDVARITTDQVAALARFVARCSPDTLQQILSMLA